MVLIPFINEEKLLSAMALHEHRLTEDETRRNSPGPMYVYSYTADNLGCYRSPGHFPDVSINHAKMTTVYREKWEIPRDQIFKGLCKGLQLDVYFEGFPTLQHLKHEIRKDNATVKVRESLL